MGAFFCAPASREGLERIWEKNVVRNRDDSRCLTIGVEAAESRNLAIYLHWGYMEFVMSEIEDGALVLYYRKKLN